MTTGNLIGTFVVLAVLLLHCSHATPLEEVDDEREFNYDIDDERGPLHWGDLREEWAACGKGKLQSPVDLSNRRVQVRPSLGRLRRAYRPGDAVLKNRGHDIMLRWEDDVGGIWINGTKYALKQMHWHTPSEHSLNGRRYNMEVHMVHESARGKIAVVGIMYTYGHPEPFLAELEEHIKVIADKQDAEDKVGMVDPRHVKRGSRNYYRYMGSLTTPPCTEGVVWTIVQKVRTVSREQVALLRDAVRDDAAANARPSQKINKRPMSLYKRRNIPSSFSPFQV